MFTTILALIVLHGCDDGLTCAPGTLERDGQCWPSAEGDTDTDTDTDADTDADSDADADSDTDSDTDTDTGLEPQPALVYLLGGQSNMVGIGQVNALPPSQRVEQDDVWIYWSGWPAWRGLQPSSDYSDGYGSYMGPEVAFGRAIADALPDRDVFLIKHGVGGTDLAEFWYPGVDDADPSMGEGYEVWLQTVRDGLAALNDEGVEYEIAGMIWMQGESDATYEPWADAYADNLAGFIQRVREDVEVEGLRFSLGLIDGRDLAAYRETVRAAQQAVAAADERVFAFETEDLGTYPTDGWHYQGTGLRVMGQRFAATLLGEDPPAFPAAAVQITGSYSWHYYGDFTLGYRFELRQPITLTDLGLFDLGSDGLVRTAEVALWNTTTGSLLLSEAVPSTGSADSSLYGGFRWVGVEPTSLLPGDYIVVCQTFSSNFDYYVHNAQIETPDAVTWIEGRYGSGTALAIPQNVSSGSEDGAHWFGGNLMFQDPEGEW